MVPQLEILEDRLAPSGVVITAAQFSSEYNTAVQLLSNAEQQMISLTPPNQLPTMYSNLAMFNSYVASIPALVSPLFIAGNGTANIDDVLNLITTTTPV